MDKIRKALRKLGSRERQRVAAALQSILAHEFIGLDIAKLAGRQDIYRVRVSSMRIIFRIRSDGGIFILAVERRSDTTYNF